MNSQIGHAGLQMDPGMIYLHHCGHKIFCFVVPDKCPICKNELMETDEVHFPVRIPYPFLHASQYPCAVVIKPSRGDFLNNYTNMTDLHVGLTTEDGLIVEFDHNGLQMHATDEWNQCLLLDQVTSAWREQWNITLKAICGEQCWSKNDYDEFSNNCFTFVLKFLQNLNHEHLSLAASSKTNFCEKYVVSKITTAAKYVSLYKAIKTRSIYIEDLQS